MQLTLLEPIENMALSEDNQQWVLDKIREAVHPNGWKRVANWLRYWGMLGIVITAFFSLIAIIVALTIFGTNRVGQESEFRGKTGQRLDSIENRLTGIEGALKLVPAQIAAKQLSIVSPKELKDHHEELAGLKKTLATVQQNTPNYWPTTFQIITLLSQAVTQLETIGKQPLSTFDNVRFVGMPVQVIRNQNVILRNTIEGMYFENSVIHFDSTAELFNVGFSHCVFIFPRDANPSMPLQYIGQTLLASDLSKVTFGKP